MKRLINKNRLILIMCLFLSVYSNKIRKREDEFEKLNRNWIIEANIELKDFQKEKKDDRNIFLRTFFPKPIIVFHDLIFLIKLVKRSKINLIEDLRINYTFDSETRKVESFRFKCHGSSEIFVPSEGDIKYINNGPHKKYSMFEYIKKQIAQYIVLRECAEKLFKCKNLESLCIINHIASQLEQEVVIFKPGDHAITKENLGKSKSLADEEYNHVVTLNKNVKLAILYSSKQWFTFKSNDPFTFNSNDSFNFHYIFNNFNSIEPYLIILHSKDENQIKSFNEKECPICLEEFKVEDAISLECGHNYHIECLISVIDEKCPLCRKEYTKEYIKLKQKELKNEKIINKFKEDIMRVEDLNDPISKFYIEYKKFTEDHPNPFFKIDESMAVDLFLKEETLKERKATTAARLMHFISKVYYLDPKKISNNIESLP